MRCAHRIAKSLKQSLVHGLCNRSSDCGFARTSLAARPDSIQGRSFVSMGQARWHDTTWQSLVHAKPAHGSTRRSCSLNRQTHKKSLVVQINLSLKHQRQQQREATQAGHQDTGSIVCERHAACQTEAGQVGCHVAARQTDRTDGPATVEISAFQLDAGQVYPTGIGKKTSRKAKSSARSAPARAKKQKSTATIDLEACSTRNNPAQRHWREDHFPAHWRTEPAGQSMVFCWEEEAPNAHKTERLIPSTDVTICTDRL